MLHVLRVMFGCQSPEAQVAAALHDVVEDTDWTLDDLRARGVLGDGGGDRGRADPA